MTWVIPTVSLASSTALALAFVLGTSPRSVATPLLTSRSSVLVLRALSQWRRP